MAAVAPTGLTGWVRSNDGRSLGLFMGFLLAVQLLAAPTLFLPLVLFDVEHAPVLAWGGYLLRYAPLVLVASVAWFGWKYWWHIESVKKAVGFHFIDDRDEPYLCQVIEPLITMWGLPVPFVGVIESEARNAFACGIGRKKAVVVVTRGLIDGLTREELECVLAHELSHIKNGDIRLMAAANIFMAALGDMQRKNPMQMTPVHILMALAVPAMLPITLVGNFLGRVALRAGQMSRLVIASRREFIADAEAVALTKNPGAMASALVKVEHAHVVEGMRREDDAMMIAGDTDGENATHPTVAQRIAALARTTGSMVFNSPHSPRADQFAENPSLSAAQAAALLHTLPPAQVAARVRAGSKVNWLGLDLKGSVMALLIVGGLVGLHWDELGQPRVMLAKFDARPIGIIAGNSLRCPVGAVPLTLLGQFDALCSGPQPAPDYSAFADQKNTLAGVLAAASARRAAQGYANPGITLGNLTTMSENRGPYRGQSGLLTGVSATYADAERTSFVAEHGFTSGVPEALQIAEIEQVGCYQQSLFYNEPEGHFDLDDDRELGYSVARWESNAAMSVNTTAPFGSAEHDAFLKDYAETRTNLTTYSYSNWGLAGLARIQAAYRAPAHEIVLQLLAKRLADPAFAAGYSTLDKARLASLVKRPEDYMPCLVRKQLAQRAGAGAGAGARDGSGAPRGASGAAPASL